MELLDSRRLTGANSILDRSGAVIDVSAPDDQVEAIVAAWSGSARQLLDAVDWGQEEMFVRRCTGGVSLAISAPIDALYAATEVNECAWELAIDLLPEHGADPIPEQNLASQASRLKKLIRNERQPALVAMQIAADRHRVTFLHDEQRISVGAGTGSRVWDVAAIPAPDQVDWDKVHDIPVGLVTGTNGKTTSIRMAAAIAGAAGRITGLSSTDSITIDDQLIARGDYAGPEGARAILRDPRVEIAVLETARGGLLRRGVGVPHATAALITRIARDHIGDFGSRTIGELLDIKWVVTRALDRNGPLVLNADDDKLVQRAPHCAAPVIFFSLDSASPVITRQIAGGGQAWALHQGQLARWENDAWHGLIEIDQIPLTLGGAARHNIANALGAAALCRALGVSDTAIKQGLSKLTEQDNPGRGNLFETNGVRVLVDFAHNPDAFRAIVEMSRALDANRRLIAFGEAGDRTDELIRDLARIAWQLPPDRVITMEIARYSRGRSPGEIAGLLHDEFSRLGADAGQISHQQTELGALKEALDWARPGDMIIMLSLAERADVLAYLADLART